MTHTTLPKTAYVLLWFPEATETFLFRECLRLHRAGLPLAVFSLYGEKREGLSGEMLAPPMPVERLGAARLGSMLGHVRRWLARNGPVARDVLRRLGFVRWGGWEKTGENLWGMLCGFALASRFDELGIRHIHSGWAGGSATAAWVASRLTGIPFSFSARAYDIHPPDTRMSDKIAAASFVRVNTAANVEHLRSLARVADREKVRLVYNGLSIEAAGRAVVPMADPVRLLAVGRCVPKKGFEYLVHAVALPDEGGPDIRLTIAGDGPLRCGLERLARELGVADKVEFAGFVDHERLKTQYLRSDMLVVPSVVAPSGDRDGIPNVIMEAFAHGLPVVATDVSGIGELVRDGETGKLVAQRDPQALARAIGELAADRKAALALAEAGAARTREMFDPERNTQALMELFAKNSLSFEARSASEK